MAVTHGSPFLTERRGRYFRRNPIVVQRVIDIDVRTDNLHAAMV